MNLIVSAAIVLLNPYVTVYISYKIPPFALSVHIPDVSTSIYVEVDSKVLLGLPSCDKAFVCRKRSIPTHSERLIHPQLLLNRP